MGERGLALRLLLALALPGVAAAQKPGKADAKQEMAAGEQALIDANTARLNSDFIIANDMLKEALEHFTLAHTLAPDATGPTLGMALALEGLGRCKEALPLLEEYLAKKTEGRNPAAEPAHESCQVVTGVASYVAFKSSPPGATVVLEGVMGKEILGQAPLPSRLLLPGDYKVIFTLEGRRPVERALALKGGELLLLDVDIDHPRRPPKALFWAAGGALAGAGVAALATAIILGGR